MKVCKTGSQRFLFLTALGPNMQVLNANGRSSLDQTWLSVGMALKLLRDAAESSEPRHANVPVGVHFLEPIAVALILGVAGNIGFYKKLNNEEIAFLIGDDIQESSKHCKSQAVLHCSDSNHKKKYITILFAI